MKKPVMKTSVRKTGVKKLIRTVAKTAAKKPTGAKDEGQKRSRAKVTREHPGNLLVDDHDHAAKEAIRREAAKTDHAGRARRRTAVDIAAEPPVDEASAASMVARVSDAIERELSKIERIVGNPLRMLPAQRIETESRARVLASLARTLKEVMRLREQERTADEDNAKAADDDTVPRDLDEFRRELSRRLEGMVAAAAPLPAGEHEPG